MMARNSSRVALVPLRGESWSRGRCRARYNGAVHTRHQSCRLSDPDAGAANSLTARQYGQLTAP